ncbi:MAG: sigma 54-interacting transcriptional regulator [Planctomycetaceae bacterium]|nr:sigma 54-interacting transcriptional regulator [Planctomycetaceae bacterium]
MSQRRPQRGLAVWITSSPLPMFVVDERRVVLMFNAGCEELTGWSAADVIGKPCDYQIDGRPEALTTLTGILAPPPEVYEGQSFRTPVVITTLDGSTHECVIDFHALGTLENDKRFRVLGILLKETARQSGVVAAMESAHAELARRVAESQQRFGVPLIALTPAMQRVAAQVKLAQSNDTAVHIQGDAGTGKEHLARRIHYAGSSGRRPFVPIDCRQSHAELTRLIERVFEFDDPAFQPGTLCLKHVEALPRDLQVTIRQEYRTARNAPRLCSTSCKSIDAGLVDDTLDAEFHSLITPLIIQLPTLSQREPEFLLLAQQLLEQFNHRQEKQVIGLTAEAGDMLLEYWWPGNVRELEEVIYSAWQRCTKSRISVDDLPPSFLSRHLADDASPTPSFPQLADYLAEAERTLLMQALEAAQGNKTVVAGWLGVPRAKLYRRLEAHQLLDSESVTSQENDEAQDS